MVYDAPVGASLRSDNKISDNLKETLIKKVRQGCTAWYFPTFMFYYVYRLYNPLKNFIYTGYSEDLKQRVLSHNAGENKSTKAFLPLELIHYQAYRNKTDAKRREMYFKTTKGKTTLRTMLKEYFSQKNN